MLDGFGEPRKEGSGLSLRWLGTAGFHVRTGGGELLLDPFLSRPPGARPAIPLSPREFQDVSLILISHGHFDHAMDVPALARSTDARIHAPLKTCGVLRRQGVPPSRLAAHERLSPVCWHGVRIRAVPSRHIVFDRLLIRRTVRLLVRGRTWPELLRLARRYPVGSNWEILLHADGYRILFSGSGGGDPAVLARLKPHCYMLPFAGRSDLTEHCLAALRRIRPHTVVLHHFDAFWPFLCVDYPVEAFRERLSREMPEIRLIVPEPKKVFHLP